MEKKNYTEVLKKIEHLRELNKERDVLLLELEYTILSEQYKLDFADIHPVGFKWKMMARYEQLRELRSKGGFWNAAR
jgi:hypothetical protein